MTTFTAVQTTGIYCRPGCAAQPLKENTILFDLAAAAEAEGFRPCMRCRPYRSAPPSYETGPDLVCRAVGMILDGYLDSSTEAGLARELGASPRHLRRLFHEHLGITPSDLARSSRAHFARRLLDDTDLSVTDIAYASGFGSVRQMNRVMQRVFRASPTELRAKRRKTDRLVADGGLPLRLPFDGKFAWNFLISHLADRSIPGVENVIDDCYVRTVVVDGDPGVLEVTTHDDQHLMVVAHLPHWEGLIHIARRVTGIFGLNTSTKSANQHLEKDPLLGRLLTGLEGVRTPGCWDPLEVGTRALIAQGRSPAETETVMRALVNRFGSEVSGLHQLGLTHTFPSAGVLQHADLTSIGLDVEISRTIRSLAVVLADNYERPSRSPVTLARQIGGIPGIDRTSAQYVSLRMGVQNAFPIGETDLEKAVAELTLDPENVYSRSTSWSPWRAQATSLLWASRTRSWTASRV